jgi:hypothetical protein
MTSAQAIQALNESRLRLPPDTLATYSRIIARAANLNDRAAICWLWLFYWNPQQLVN